jgi:hypothetical protein
LTEIVPTVGLPPVAPFTSQVMDAPAAPQNDAENVCVLPSGTLAVAGETEFVAEHTTVTLALADFVLSARLAAVTVTDGGDGGTEGAVYSAVVAPPAPTVPTVALPPAIPFTLQMRPAAALPEPETVTVKTCAPPVGTVAVCGEIFTAMLSVNVTAAEAEEVASAALTAVTVMLGGNGRIPGAV